MEMISPEQYKEMNKDKDIKELIQIKTELESEINELKQLKNSIFISDTRLPMNEQYLEQVNNLIIEKENNNNVSINNDKNKFTENITLNEEYDFYKKNENDIIWWVNNKEKVGEHLFTFDKNKIYNLFRDYPYVLTKEEKEIFDKENPYWADYFKDRNNK